MKKLLLSGFLLLKDNKLLHLFRIMRITTYLLIFFTNFSFSVNMNSQNTKITLDISEESLTEVLNQIEQQTDFLFISNKEVDITRKVNIRVRDKTVKEVLNQLFQNTNLTYEIAGVNIVLSRKTAVGQSLSVEQEKKTMQGIVVDQSGEPIPGVNVLIKGTTEGTITNIDGKYTIIVPNEKSVLVFSFIGFINQEIQVGSQITIDVKMAEDAQGLDEVVVVGYGTQRKSTLTGSIASVKSEQLTISPVGNVTNTLTGKLPGLITKQSSGMPGSDMAELNIRGFGSPLVIVDGVEGNLQNLDSNQIENITILKDGAASIYGSRAGNGVVLVTTKRGVNQKPTITVNASYTLQGVTNLAKTASSGQLAQMQREAHLQSGLPEASAPFTAEAVAKYFAGDDPAYASYDWYNAVFRDWAPQENENISIRGGSDKIKYMGFFGYQNQETMIKKNGGSYSRYNLQSNIDAVVTSRISLSVDINASFDNGKFPGRGIGKGKGIIWQDLYNTKPWYPTSPPDPEKLSYGGIDVGSVALSSNMDIWGYQLNKQRDLRGTVTLSYDVPFIEGLKAKAMVNYLDWEGYSKKFQRPYKFYTYNQMADLYTLAGEMWGTAEAQESVDFSRQFTQQYSLNYDRVFNTDHHITALALFESIEYSGNNFWAFRRGFLTPSIEQLFVGSDIGKNNSGSASEMGRMSVIGRINYSYKDKYLLETILRADASAKFPKDKRWGYFPSVSIGWTISKEDFMANLTALDLLKFRVGYGSSGYDYQGNFQYLSGYNISGLYQFGDDFVSGLAPTSMANPLLTWEQMDIYNVGVDFSFKNRMIYGTVEGFYRAREGIMATRARSLPGTFGATTPLENINSSNDRGFELSLGTAKNIGDLHYDINANISWSRAKWDHFEEADYTDPDQKRLYQASGRWADRMVGYLSEGLFTSQKEIEELTYSYAELGGNNATLRPGDIKYKDVNDDGILDWRDQQEIGKGNTPHWFYGISGTFAYKNFDLSAIFQGAAGYSTTANRGFETETKYNLRWTETNNNPKALIPRLGGSASNGWSSDYWIKSTSYLRLKNIALGYTIPNSVLTKIGIEKLRVYVSGTNLFTLNSLRKYNMDPEVPSGYGEQYYPQQRTISFGINLSF